MNWPWALIGVAAVLNVGSALMIRHAARILKIAYKLRHHLPLSDRQQQMVDRLP